MAKFYDVAIIGGGAAGMAAAIELKIKAPDLAVVIIEKNESLGRKIRATGSGRCNITNTKADGYLEILAFFTKLGLMTKAYDNGLVYPRSESAADVVEFLITKLVSLGVDVIYNASVSAVDKEDNQFAIVYEMKQNGDKARDEILTADHVILALGGKAGPSYGTTGDGYGIARGLGHSIIAPIPVLTSLECEEWNNIGESPNARGAITLAGTRTACKVSLYEDEIESFGDDTLKFTENGELQLTKYGLSGICIFNMTRYMRYNRAGGESLSRFLVKIDLFPEGDIRQYLEDRRNGLFSDEKLANILCTVLKPNVAEYVLRVFDYKNGARNHTIKDRTIASLSDAELEKLAAIVHNLEFHPTGVKGWKEAQATSGGVKLDEVNANSYESIICPGLYIAGELLDYDGPCGGYNLSNAWLSGIHAANDIAEIS